VRVYWPPLLLSGSATVTYLLVHVEDRYLGGILLVLSLLPLTVLLDPTLSSRRSFLAFVVALYLLCGLLELEHNCGATLQAALHRRDFHRDPQWKLAAALASDGFRPGDTVALVGSGEPNFLCSWAYLARIRLVAEFGSLPWRIEPWTVRRLTTPRRGADNDSGIAFWNLPPEQRERVIRAFQGTGARRSSLLHNPDLRQLAGHLLPTPGRGSTALIRNSQHFFKPCTTRLDTMALENLWRDRYPLRLQHLGAQF